MRSTLRSFTRLGVLGAFAGAALAGCSSPEALGPGAQVPAAVQYVSGNGQTGNPGATLANDFVIKVVDSAGTAVPGVQVAWTVQSGGGTLSQTLDTTDIGGFSSVRLTAGALVGNQTVLAAVQGLSGFTFTAGVGTTTPPDTTVVPSGRLVFRTVDVGSYHACAITTSEQAFCWGFNQDAELGNGTFTLSPTPVAVSGGLNFRQVSGGRYHTCATTFSGDGYCWGSNSEGELGVKTSVNETTPKLNQRAVTFMAQATGLTHTCAVTQAGYAVCWGSNIGGQLGFATKNTSADTVGFVRTAEIFSRVTAGRVHSCGLVAAPSPGGYPAGAALCWGFNDRGQLGNGTTAATSTSFDTSVVAPTAVVGGLAFDSITAGYNHTCALTSAGAAYCWGDNTYGQLGDGSTTLRSAPVAVGGGHTFVMLSAGFFHTCGIDTNGAAWCWGRNTPNSLQESKGGQLGDGTTNSSPTPVLVAGGLVWSSISAGETTSCGVTTAGVAYCWGDNEYGQLGSGSTTASSVPVKVANQP